MSFAEPAHRTLASAPAAGMGARYGFLPLLLIAWAAVAGASLVGSKPVFDAMSMDDYMRLVEVRDFIDGQGWHDLRQYRLDPPAGVLMHWSRLVDLPIAALILSLSPLVGRGAAEIMVAALWPLLLLLPAFALAGAIARRLAGETAALAAVLLAAVSAPALVHFRPGALDHHGLQLLLVLGATAGAMMPGDRRLAPAAGGLAAALSLAVGLEMVPALAAILTAVGLRWALQGVVAARMASNFGLGFGAGTVALYIAMTPPAAWGAAGCDSFSAAWVAAAGLAGGGLAWLAVASARFPSVGARLLGGCAVALAAGALFALGFPACLGDPYADLDPRMAALWLAHVSEAQNALDVMRNSSEEALPIYGPLLAVLMLGAAVMARAKPAERVAWLTPMFTLIALVAVALWQVRGAAGANLIAQALIAAALVRLTGTGEGTYARLRLFAAMFALSSPVLVIAGQGAGAVLMAIDSTRPVVFQDGPGACRRFADVAPLARQERGLVLSFLDLGPAILAGTDHSVLAAPYHRNRAGNTAVFDALLGDDTTASRVLAERQIDYVAVCPGGPERINFERAAPDGLAARLSRGEVPYYLEAAAGDAVEPLRVFRVRR